MKAQNQADITKSFSMYNIEAQRRGSLGQTGKESPRKELGCCRGLEGRGMSKKKTTH